MFQSNVAIIRFEYMYWNMQFETMNCEGVKVTDTNQQVLR
jgi:hypothetical protein